MVMLRSRKILCPSTKSLPEPVTPAQTREPSTRRLSLPSHELGSDSTRRRSLRLASKSVPRDQNGSRKRKISSIEKEKEETEEQNSAFQVNDNDNVDSEMILSLRSGKRVVKRKVEYDSGENLVIEAKDLNVEEFENVSDKDKGKAKLTEKLMEKQSVVEGNCSSRLEVNKFSHESSNSMRTKRRYSREEKGKANLDDDGLSNSIGKDELELQSKVKELGHSLGENVVLLPGNERQTMNINTSNKNESRMDQFRDIATRNASRFAQFDRQEDENLPSEVDNVEISSVEENERIEDWPGPFSTAMKIIRDRANMRNSQQGASTLEKPQSVPITWVPTRNRQSRTCVPSLQELCMRIIVKNVDAVTSLDHVPDALRHRLCQLLCDCRKMNSSFLDLLVRGSPTEIRVKDCSWMSEEELVKCFEGCDTNNLSVLQLDQCGRCMPDYVIPATLARSSRSLPALITLSLCGACRLSDIGLSLLVASATSLRSINLSQCSHLTSTSIGTLADSLGSVLRELYIDDCQSLDAMLILPSLKKLEHLEVLSLAGIQTVCDDFVREFVVACGHNIKEFGLADCTKLTDSSLKVIAETCPGLCALNLVNLRKLTDSTLGFLANGCREIQTLKLCRNAFSDEGIAAFLESSGDLLKELSLNNVKKVGHHTAISLARRSRNLISLDLSWCRNLSDEAVGLIVDSCSSLRVLKLFGCGQITKVFLDGHSNPEVKIIGLKMSPVLEHLWVRDSQEFPLRYSSTPSFL
ncbi:uncharacterized protein LOC8281183 [Ricinus communis]|uniref:uncharacterized protein LOC8281183 n=1 Tax=Ricinus communis TaxID=3988 RepID=UPI00077273E0|nr:uncharacterized protein LOC8281183 [Ricinus communis]|eukprot:XP_015572876.1 uncharacterized protein LOC8281183 [Ricinus communis]